jgi:hypothetical protein
MVNRYEEATQNENDLMREIRAEHFPELRNANIKVLFDLKRRMYGGKIILARCQRASDLIRHLTQDAEVEEGVDYIVYLDKICWENTTRPDHIRIMRHELRHPFFDAESEKAPYKTVDHDIEDFSAEIPLNQDDISWRQRVADLTLAIYEQKKDEEETEE